MTEQFTLDARIKNMKEMEKKYREGGLTIAADRCVTALNKLRADRVREEEL